MNSDFRSITSLSIYKTLSLFLSLGNSLLMVYLFGTGNNIEIWFLSHLIFNSFLSISQTGLISEITIPTYIRLFKENEDRANYFYSFIITITTAIGFFILLIIFLTHDNILEFLIPTNEKISDSLYLYSLIISSLIPISILNINLSSLLNAHKVFGKIELIKIFKQLISILSIIIFNKFGLISLFAPFIITIILETLILILAIKKIKFKFFINFSISNLGFNFNIKQISISTIFYSILSQIFNIILNKYFLNLGQVYFISYSYVNNLFKAIRNTTLFSIKTVFLTSFSQNKSNFNSISRKNFIIDRSIGLFIIGILVNSEYLLEFLWRNPEFGKESIIISQQILKVLMIAFIFSLLTFFGTLKIKVEEKFHLLLKNQCFVLLISIIILNLFIIINFYEFTILLLLIPINSIILLSVHLLIDKSLIKESFSHNRILFYLNSFILFYILNFLFKNTFYKQDKLSILIYGFIILIGASLYVYLNLKDERYKIN